MAIKSEISWTRETPEGERIRVYARRFGGEWRFYSRKRRSEPWQAMKTPPIEDWHALLDAVARRVPRSLFPPAELVRIEQAIRERFPSAAP